MGLIYDTLAKSDNLIRDFSKAMSEATRSRRLLSSFVLELSPVCNLSCKMCYVRLTEQEIKQQGRRILRFDDWKKIIDELTLTGAHNCTLTGGECTIHPDFMKIYEHIYNKNVNITLMTNGTNITDEIFEMLKKMPPISIYITLYGSSKKTYRELCGNASAFEAVTNNIKKLKAAGFPVVLQFTGTKYNQADLEAVNRFATDNDLNLRYTDLLIEFGNSTKENIDAVMADHDSFRETSNKIRYNEHNITPEEYEANKSNELRFVPPSDEPIIEKGITCNAGQNTCFISWRGEMQACTTLDAFKVDVLDEGVESAWKKVVNWADNIPRITECQKCLFRHKCKQCIAIHYGDTKQFGKPSPRLCWKQLFPEDAKRIEEEYLASIKSKDN